MLDIENLFVCYNGIYLNNSIKKMSVNLFSFYFFVFASHRFQHNFSAGSDIKIKLYLHQLQFKIFILVQFSLEDPLFNELYPVAR